MKNLTLYHWIIAVFSAVFCHALVAFTWSGVETSKIEKSAGIPVTIVGSLSAFAEQQAAEETIEEVSEAVEELSEIKPVDPVIEPVENVIEKEIITKELANDEQSNVPTIKPVKNIIKEKLKKKKKKKLKKKTNPKKKKAKKKQKKRLAAKRVAALRKGGGARGKQKKIAGRAAISNYRGRVQSHLARYKRGVSNSRGRVVVSFTIARSGGVRAVRVIKSSGNRSIDRAALAMVRRASPFPHIPRGGPGSMRFTVPISYQ